MKIRSIFRFAVMVSLVLAVFAGSFALAEGSQTTYLDAQSGKVTFKAAGCTASWATVSADGTPILAINVTDSSKLEDEQDLYFKIPITISLQKPAAISDKEATPYIPVGRVDEYGGLEFNFQSVASNSFIYYVFVPCNDLYGGSSYGDAFAIKWQDKNGNILMREMLQYSVSLNEPDSFDSVSRPVNRVTVTIDEKLTEGDNPAVKYAFADNGDLTFTVHAISKDTIKALYLPGMNSINANVTVVAPSGYNKYWAASGDMTYQEFVDGYTTESFENNIKYSNGRKLWQIDETDNEITVIPMKRELHYYMLCWQGEGKQKYPEVLKISIVMADDAKVVTIPKSELDNIPNVPDGRISSPGISDANSQISQVGAAFSYSNDTGIALYELKNKTPQQVIALAESNNWNSIPIDVWVKVPDGCKAAGTYTMDGWTGDIFIREQDGVKYAEIGRGIYGREDGIYSQDVDVFLNWEKNDGTVVKEKFHLKSTFPGYTWMDEYWAPAPVSLITTSLDKDTLEKYGYEVSITEGKVHCAFKDDVLPTVEQMEQLRNLQLIFNTIPNNTARVRFNSSSGSLSTEYSTRAANNQRGIINSSGSVNPDGMWLGSLCPLDKRSVGDMGIDYYCAILEENHVMLLQFYDQSGNIIKIGEDDGYYYTIEVEPFHYAVSSTVVDDIANAEKDSSGIVKQPTLVLPELGNNAFTFTAQLFPQQINSSDKNPNIKYYLRLETDVPSAMLEDGVDVYIPYSMIHPDLTYEKALDDKNFKVKHLYDDDSHKETLSGEPTEYGMKFEVNSFSPFVIEVEEEEQSGNNAPGNIGSSGSGSSGISITYNGGNSFSTSNSAVPTSVEIDGIPVSFTGDGRSFTVNSIPAGAKWITVRWNSTSITTNFAPDGNVVSAGIEIPKTGDKPIWTAVAAFFGF